MSVRALHPQEAQHVESGAILGSAGRDAMTFEIAGLVMTIPVDRGDHRMRFTLPAIPRWDNGDPISADLAERLQPIISEIARFWDQEPEFRVLLR